MNTYELAEPLSTIFNTSLASGILPAVWKESKLSDRGDSRETYKDLALST